MNDLLRSGQPSTSDNAKEEDEEKLGSQNRHQLSKCKDSKDLPKELVENLEATPNIATLPGGHFDIQNMSVDTLMDEVVSCIVTSMDDCTDSADLVSVKSSEYQNIDANCITEGIAEVLHGSDIRTASRDFADAHVNTTGLTIIQKTNMAARNGDQEIRDILGMKGYAEEIGENVSFIKEKDEKDEKEDNCTRATAQQDTTKHDMLEDNQSRVVKSNPELNEISCGSHGSKSVTGKESSEKYIPREILAILKKENTPNGSCQVPLTESESKDTPGKEVKGQKNKSNEGSKSDSQNSCATPGTVRRSSRLRDRQNT